MELGELPAGWLTTTLGEVAAWGSGGTPSRSRPEYFRGSIPWIKTGELGAKYIRDAEERISEAAIAQSSAKVFPKGAVGIAMYGATIGKLSIWGIDAATNQACAVGICGEALNNEFLYYFLTSEKRSLIKAGKGGAQPNISQGIIKEWPLNLPPLAEQHRIVAKIEELFSELDQGVASLKTARDQLKVYRQSLLKDAFAGKLTAAWRAAHRDQLETAAALQQRIAREREAHHRQQLSDWQAKGGPKPRAPKPLLPLTAEELAELPELPEGWIYSYLAYMGDLGRGKSKHRPRNDPRLFGGSFPFIQTGEVKAANRVIRSYFQTYSEFGLAQSKLWPKGTLCITIAANIAETAFLGFDGCFPDSVVGFTAFEPIVYADYIDYFIQAARTRIEAYAPATAQKNINLETLENLVVPYCSRAEQEAVLSELESKLSEADQLDQTLATALQQADALRQSILKKAFCGQLVEQDENDEPTTVLLERIRGARLSASGKKKTLSTAGATR